MSVMKYKDPTTGEIKKVGAPKVSTYTPFKPAGKSYLTFSSPNSFTLAAETATKYWAGTLEYFASDRTWTTWDGTTPLSSIDKDGEYVLYLRGTGNTALSYHNETEDTYTGWVINGTDVRCNGNIETLLDYATVETGQHPAMANYCFCTLFVGCAALTKAPDLPATTLVKDCYGSMFAGCTSLTQAPALPATTLAGACYAYMFYGCTGLTQAPELPATTLTDGCYQGMFRYCTGLTQAPALPATTLASFCYRYMFQNCTGLTQAPSELPATTLASNCYMFMFEFTAITAIPRIMATTYATDSCKGSTMLKHSMSTVALVRDTHMDGLLLHLPIVLECLVLTMENLNGQSSMALTSRMAVLLQRV